MNQVVTPEEHEALIAAGFERSDIQDIVRFARYTGTRGSYDRVLCSHTCGWIVRSSGSSWERSGFASPLIAVTYAELNNWGRA